MSPKILVVQPIPARALNALQELADVDLFDEYRMPSRDELIARIQHCDYFFNLGDTTIDAEFRDAIAPLKGIATMGIAPRTIDVDHATERKILVSHIPNIVYKSTADLTMAHIIGLAWRIAEADRFVRAHRFRQEQSPEFLGTSMEGKTLGFIGFGLVGQEVAKRARPFGFNMIYTKRTRLSSGEEHDLDVEWVADNDEVLRRSDFFCLVAGYNASTHLMIGAPELALMKPTAFFINTSRGRIVDEDALVAALRDGVIAGAGLDVFWHEPPVSDPAPHPALLSMENVLLTGHIGTATAEMREEMAMITVANITAMISGRRPPNLWNDDAFDS